jgi:ankyrin repeat protein
MMIRNKNLKSIFPALVLTILLMVPAQVPALDAKSYFAVTKFNIKARSAKDAEQEKKASSALNPELIYRTAFGRVDDVRILLEQGADPNARNDARLPVLMIATIRKDEEAPKIAAELLKKGANVNIIGPNGTPPVLEAVRGGRADVLQVLIDNKAVLGTVTDSSGHDLLALAERRGDLEIVDILNAAQEKEKDLIESLKSEDNFIRLIQEYSFLSCANEYLNYYISTEPKGIDIVQFNNVVTANSDEVNDTARKIRLIFKMGNKELGQIQYDARSQIITQLKYYETNENREINGVGKDEDLNKRCWAIAKKWTASRFKRGDQYRLNTIN